MQHLLERPLFVNALVSGLVASSTIFSSGINLIHEVISARCVAFLISSTTSIADVGFFVAGSPDGTNWGSHSDNSAIFLSTKSYANSAGWFFASMPPIGALTPYLRIVISGTGSNPVDTRVTASLWLNME